MARFTFRLQVALDLRRRQEDEARTALAAAEMRKRDAERERDVAAAALEGAMSRAREADGRSGPLTERLWYRNWILAQRREVDRRQRGVDAAADEVRQATARAQQAYRKRRMLEKLRERSVRGFDAAERRDEQKAIDDLGTLRHDLARRGVTT
jgi:flagellar FliJ protein